MKFSTRKKRGHCFIIFKVFGRLGTIGLLACKYLTVVNLSRNKNWKQKVTKYLPYKFEKQKINIQFAISTK